MKRFLWILALAGALGSAANALPNAPDVIPAKGGAIRITPIFHASFQIEYRGKVIHVDPFSGGDYTGAKKADLILITHSHPDHLDLKAIRSVLKPNQKTMAIVCPPAAKPSLKSLSSQVQYGIDGIDDLNNYASVSYWDDNDHGLEWAKIGIQAVPAYNLVRGPKSGQKFHPKGQFNGYILEFGGKIIYIAGDTEVTPEMKELEDIDIAFLPMNLPFTMTPQEAAVGARAFKPKVVYPYHYRYPFDKINDNPQQFAKALEGSGIEVKMRGWYAHPAPKTNG